MRQQVQQSAITDDDERRLYRKVVYRIIPFIFFCYVLNYIDRVNVSFAKLQFQGDLHLSDASYGLGVGLSTSAISCSRYRAIWFYRRSAPARPSRGSCACGV
jgi:sugar phosphate permease